MKFMAFVTVFANISVIFGLAVVMIASIVNLTEILGSNGPGLDVNVWFVPDTFAIMLGMSIYAFEGIGVVLPCETAISKPELYNRVLLITLMISTLNYISFGLVPYLSFGRETCDLITGALRCRSRSTIDDDDDEECLLTRSSAQ